jgi:hypothetical protein
MKWHFASRDPRSSKVIAGIGRTPNPERRTEQRTPLYPLSQPRFEARKRLVKNSKHRSFLLTDLGAFGTKDLGMTPKSNTKVR